MNTSHNAPPPLAERMRPEQLTAMVGQHHLIGPDGPVQKAIASGTVASMIFWGPPGCGKTTLAHLVGHLVDAHFHHLSAVLSGIQDLRALIARIEEEQTGLFAGRHILFIDEIHRWNKAQQDALLPYVEHGTITLIGATTENPSFEIIGPLLSRTQVYVLEPLTAENLQEIAAKALQHLDVTCSDDAFAWLIQYADGDARRLLNAIECAANIHTDAEPITATHLANVVQKTILYDKQGEAHYNIISAFIKSMRASDANAAIYYLARMYEAGEDPRFVARRMVIFASEDISNADPQALPMAVAAFQAYDLIGHAEGWIPLAQVVTYLARAPKSNESYGAYQRAKGDVQDHGTLPTPLHLRNAPTQLMQDLGYGKDYRYPHNDPQGAAEHTYLPEALKDRNYYKG